MRSDDPENETALAFADTLVGSVFDKRFRIDERIAAGGFGAIYRATHVKSGHLIALKVLHPTLASDLGVLARFRREGTTLTSLRNPHTITAYEFGQVEHTLFIVMELLSGETLFDHYSTHGPLEWKRVVKIGLQVCESLEEAHAQGIVHRDLKPTNIHLEHQDGDPDFVKVLDFGIAKILRGSELDSADITNAGQMIGTLDYMSPEQMVGGNVTGQTDIYTLGIVMYEMIAGTRPFPESTTAGGALAAMLKTTPEPLYLRAPVPRPLDAVVMRCLERETTKRFRTVTELRTALEGVLHDAVPANTATVQLPKERVRLDEDDATAITPPPERILAELKTPVRRAATPLDSIETAPRRKQTPLSEWEDDDEQAPTTTRRPDGSDTPGSAAQQRATPRRSDGSETPQQRATARRPDGAETPLQRATPRRPDGAETQQQRATPRRSDGSDTAAGSPQLRPTPRPLASRHIESPPVPLVVAPFSHAPRVRSPSGPRSDNPQSLALGVAPTTPMPILPATERGISASSRPAHASHATNASPGVPASNDASTAGAFGSSLAGQAFRPAANAIATTSPGHAPGPQLMPAPPVLPAPQPPPGAAPSPRVPSARYDMAQAAARERRIRRLIWIIVLVLGAGVGFVLATQL